MKKLLFPLFLCLMVSLSLLLIGIFLLRNSHTEPVTIRLYPHGRPIPVWQEPTATQAGSSHPVFPLNINTATENELTALPGIGKVIAARIVEYRRQFGPFDTLEELLDVDGIGDATFEALQSYITLGG